MPPARARAEVVEQFTFRSGQNSITVDAVIDTGATSTVITEAIVAALRLSPLSTSTAGLAGGAEAPTTIYRCRVAWTIYESQGFHSEHDVLCIPGGAEVLIGYDFLERHDLKVDLHHKGLVGTAPDAAVPFTGGGYVINPPRGMVREVNYERTSAAKPGEVLRPHPAWRFKVPSIMKQKSKEKGSGP